MNFLDTDELFWNVGEKLQKVAKWVYIVGAVIVLIAGGIGVVASLLSGSFLVFLLTLVAVVVFVGLYIFASLISSWYIHGFGILVQKAEKDLGYKQEDTPYQPMYVNAAQTTAPADGWKCVCGKINPQYQTTCSCGVRKPHQ